MAADRVELDGSFGEGGGQILRSSLALALLTGRPFRLRNVRARRARPGLQPQHLRSVLAAAEVGRADLQGATLHSTTLEFTPGTVRPGAYHFRIGTAGATGLVLHTVYLPLALAGGPSTVHVEGGTHVEHSPCFHFLDQTWRAYLGLLGLDVALHMDRPGFYPRGGGRLRADLRPAAAPQPLQLDAPPPVRQARVVSMTASLPEHIARRQADRAARRLEELGLEVESHQEAWPGGPGTMLGVELATAPVPTFFFALGQRGKPAEAVADEAVTQAEAFLATGPAGVDEHSADQLLLPLVFAPGPSRFPTARVSAHLRTNAAVLGRFLDRPIRCEGAEGQPGVVHVD